MRHRPGPSHLRQTTQPRGRTSPAASTSALIRQRTRTPSTIPAWQAASCCHAVSNRRLRYVRSMNPSGPSHSVLSRSARLRRARNRSEMGEGLRGIRRRRLALMKPGDSTLWYDLRCWAVYSLHSKLAKCNVAGARTGGSSPGATFRTGRFVLPSAIPSGVCRVALMPIAPPG